MSGVNVLWSGGCLRFRPGCWAVPVAPPALLVSTGAAPMAFWSGVFAFLPASLRLILRTWSTLVTFCGFMFLSAVSWPWNTVTPLAVALALAGLSVVRTSTG